MIKTNLLPSWRYGRSMTDVYLWLTFIGEEPELIRDYMLTHMELNNLRMQRKFRVI